MLTYFGGYSRDVILVWEGMNGVPLITGWLGTLRGASETFFFRYLNA